MNNRVSSIRNLRTIRALRGDTLKIDLGISFVGTMRAWMKKDPQSSTYREFTIEDNRYLVLPSIKTSDYYFNGGLIEAIAGKWYFDVELETDLEVKTVYTGKILFINNTTGTLGVELTPSTENGLLIVESFTASANQTSYIVGKGLIKDNGFTEIIVNGQHWNSRTGVVSFPGGNIDLNFNTGEVTFLVPLDQGDQVVIKYS